MLAVILSLLIQYDHDRSYAYVPRCFQIQEGETLRVRGRREHVLFNDTSAHRVWTRRGRYGLGLHRYEDVCRQQR